MKRFAICLGILLGAVSITKAEYVINKNVRDILDAAFNLKTETARTLIVLEHEINPTNYYAYYLEELIDAIELITMPSEARFETFKDNHDRRREIMDGKSEDSPYYLSCKAEMSFFLGMFRMRFDERINGFRSSLSALKETGKNLEDHPGFRESLNLKAFFNLTMANLPPFARWAIGFFGIKIEPNTGIDMLTKNLNSYEAESDRQMTANTALIMIIGYKINKVPDMGYKFILNLDESIKSYSLIKFFEANLAFRSGHNEEALAILNDFDVSQIELQFDHYNYMMGHVLLKKLDRGAGSYFNKFLSETQFRSYTKEATYKLAEYYSVMGQEDKFKAYKELAEDTEGDELVERDREATYDSELDYDPDPNLLKARLLLSGGYLSPGIKELKLFKAKNNDFLPYQTAYYLLLGEYYFKLNNHSQAIINLKKAIELGEDEDYQLASAAAVLLAKVYDDDSEMEMAQRYYELAIELYEDEYYEYIDSYAKSRLSQITVEQ
jgi:tetratricopeptide (TPR) repeat protein